MTFLVIAYALIAAVLSGYGISVWRRVLKAEAGVRALEDGRN